MRQLLIIYGACIAGLCFRACLAVAAGVQGRVVDSAGQPVAEAEVRIWQNLPDADGWVVPIVPLNFGDDDVLHTDDQGQFTSPDVLIPGTFSKIVVEATGFLSGRSGWIEIRKDAAVTTNDIVLRPLRTVFGRVIDRQNRPVADARVFDPSDGHKLVETKTDATGKFRLVGVPEGDVFLFAEKPGYRFTGIHLHAEQSAAAVVLATREESVEPLATLPPMLSGDEEAALARQAFDRWFDQIEKSGGNPFRALRALADLDPIGAQNRVRGMRIAEEDRIRLEGQIVHKCIKRRVLSWDELRPLIEGLDGAWIAGAYLAAARQMDRSEEPRRQECLALALRQARLREKPAVLLAGIAAELFNDGDEKRAGEIMSEAEQFADQLPPGEQESQPVFHRLALDFAQHDPARALAWQQNIEDEFSYIMFGGTLAVQFVSDHPDAAEEMWNRTRRRLRYAGAYHLGERGIQLADLCYRMANVDRQRAERIARQEELKPLRVRALAAIALQLNKAEPAAAQDLLRAIVRDELPRPDVAGDGQPVGSNWSTPPLTMTWLLPIAEQIDPQLGRECFWQALALRAHRPRRDKLDDEDAEADIRLAMMLSRYDRGVARALVAALAARLPEFSRPTMTTLKSRSADALATHCRNLERTIVAAAAHIDPLWACELYRGLPQEEALSLRGFQVVEALAITLTQRGIDRWHHEGGFISAFSANYWKPQ
jgi:hypothetical protein